jgi:hypothetical protein
MTPAPAPLPPPPSLATEALRRLAAHNAALRALALTLEARQ